MAMRVIQVRAAEVRRAWCDAELTLPQAAARLGMSIDALQDRARALGLAPRRTGRREVIRPHQEREFRIMWRAGVSAREIGRHLGGASYSAVVSTAARLGLAARGAGYRPRLTLEAYLQRKMGIAMAQLAQQETRARAAS